MISLFLILAGITNVCSFWYMKVCSFRYTFEIAVFKIVYLSYLRIIKIMAINMLDYINSVTCSRKE